MENEKAEEVSVERDEELDAGVDLDLGIDDIPEPDGDTGPQAVEDMFKSAVNYSFIGVGQGGSRLAQSFYEIGYRRVCVVNTAKQDLDEIKLPDNKKLWLGAGGAAKNRSLGENYAKKSYEEIINLMRRSFGPTFDRIIVCCTAGGGTGSGGFGTVVRAANDLVESLRIKKVGDSTKVGLLIALPSNSERDCMSNAWEAMKSIEKMAVNKAISPVVVIDNERINSIFRSATMGNVWEKTNKSITGLFHLFNKVSVAPTKYTAFDPADYNMILDSGFVTYGMLRIKSTDKDDLADAMRKNVSRNVLSGGFDLNTAKVSACLLLGEEKVIDDIPFENINHTYEQLGRVVGGATVYTGVYRVKQPLTAYTLIGGMSIPRERLDEISRMAGHTDWDE